MEIAQFFGQDLFLFPTGDLASSDGDDLTKQSLIRRLMTNPVSYIWHTDYGAGIGRFIGQNLSASNFDTIKNIMVSQILKEETVAKVPVPQINFKIPGIGILLCDVVYFDAKTGQKKGITLRVS